MVTATAGFLLAAKGDIDLLLLLTSLISISLVIASACVINNVIDKDIDKLMARTQKRALVAGTISTRQALLYASALGIFGLVGLLVFTNVLTFILGLVGLFCYIVMYGIFKRRSVHGTLIGSVSGAIPPVSGYTTVSNNLDLAAIVLFMILVFWQMPHFYAIAIFRLKDYAAAGIPVLPVVKGIPRTIRHMLFYIILFTLAAASLTLFGYTGVIYLLVIMALGFGWFALCLKGTRTSDNTSWARIVFFYSLIVLTTFSLFVSMSVVLP